MGYKGAHEAKLTPVQKVFTVIGAILCVIFGFLLVCNLTIIIKGAVAPEKPPSVLGTTPMVVLSGSMSGTAEDHIEVGDLIFIGKARPEELEQGDVIAFMQGTTVVTHRIVGIETGEDGKLLFTTKGDANNAEDQHPVPEDKLVGIYKARIPRVGDFAMFLQTPTGMLLFVGLPLMAFVIYDILRRQKITAKQQQRNAELKAELARLRRLSEEQDKLS